MGVAVDTEVVEICQRCNAHLRVGVDKQRLVTGEKCLEVVVVVNVNLVGAFSYTYSFGLGKREVGLVKPPV